MYCSSLIIFYYFQLVTKPCDYEKTLFLSLIISLLIGNRTKQEGNSLTEGAWQMVSIKSVSGDSVLSTFPGNYTGSEQLIFSKNHFLWVGRYKRDTTFIDNYGG